MYVSELFVCTWLNKENVGIDLKIGGTTLENINLGV
jgi:hypothetical protein